MRIEITRSGGFAGLTDKLVSLDSRALSDAQRARVAELLDAHGFWSLPADVAGGSIGADLLRYEIAVEDGAKRHTVRFPDVDDKTVAALRRLVDALVELAQG